MDSPKRVQTDLLQKAVEESIYGTMDARDAMDAFKRGFAKAMMEIHGEQITKAAYACGLYRNSLHRWLKAGKEDNNAN